MRNQNKSQIVGREGERWFSSILPSEWTIQRPIDDFGIDGIVAIGTESNVLPLEFGVQIKSSVNFKSVNGKVVVPRISSGMLQYWLRKLLPTLLVAYDAKRKVGYYDWVYNLVTNEQVLNNDEKHFLHIDGERKFDDRSWDHIRTEVAGLNEMFFQAVQSKIELLPFCKHLSLALSNLCSAELIDDTERDGQVRRVTQVAWTYVLAAREMKNLVPDSRPETYATRVISSFVDAYFRKCRKIIHEFDNCVADEKGGWIAMKKLDESKSTRIELNALLSECLFTLLRYA